MNISSGFNFDINEFLNVTYTSSMKNENPNKPILRNWTISELSLTELILKLNFTNELYVSSEFVPDSIQIMMVSPYYFKSLNDNQHTDLNYTLSTSLPEMGKSSEM